MSNLYRCHARLAYKPFKSKYLIVFEERQIQSLRVNLAVNFANGITNQRGSVIPSGFFDNTNNTCVVTLSDPYLDGVAWTSLNEINSLKGLATRGNIDALAGYLKRKCKAGESPADGCFPYGILDAQGNAGAQQVADRDRPVLILTLYYVIGGSQNQTAEITYYFDLISTSITHGVSGEPTVTLNGNHAFNVNFQRNLQPTFFDQGKNWVDEFNDKMFKKEGGYEIEDVCSDSAAEVKMDRVYRVNNLTAAEILNKFMSTVEGSQVLSLPTKEFANKIQICTRGDNSCYGSQVFYLGKGLYEKYKIRTKIPEGDVYKNFRQSTYKVEGPEKEGTTYTVSIPDPETTAKQLAEVSGEAFSAFPPQFLDVEDYSTTTFFKGSGSSETFKIERLEDTTQYGDAKSPLAYFGGEVVAVNNEEKSIRIKSNFYVHYCDKEDKCNRGTLYHEYRKLESISVKETDKLKFNASIGTLVTSPPQDKSKTRFFVELRTGEEIVMEPSSIKAMVSTSERLDNKEREGEAPTDGGQSQSERKIGEVGDSGRSYGAHLDAMWVPDRPITRADVLKYVDFGEGGSKTSSIVQSSPYGPRNGSFHRGVDLAWKGGDAATKGVPMFLKGGATILDADRGVLDPNGFGHNVEIQTPEGVMRLSHLAEGSIPSDIPESGGVREQSFSSSGVAQNGNQAVTADQDAVNLTTEFKGVPKALNILPGRTILSFLSDYDKWIESGKSPSIDPQVWIPEKYSNWYVGKVEYSWDRGDLRVKLDTYLPWLLSAEGLTGVPSWNTHKENKGYADYYDYIRSGGDLCYTNTKGENSCAVCLKTRANQPQQSSGSSSPDSVTSSYPRGEFTYTGQDQAKIQALLDAGSQIGVTSKLGQAGIVSGALQESGLNPTRISGVPGENSQGIFQWNPASNVQRLQDLKAYAQQNGLDYLAYDTQVKFFVYESRKYPNLVSELNRAKTAFEAANAFDRNYTISGDRNAGPNSANNRRRTQFVLDVLNNMR